MLDELVVVRLARRGGAAGRVVRGTLASGRHIVAVGQVLRSGQTVDRHEVAGLDALGQERRPGVRPRPRLALGDLQHEVDLLALVGRARVREDRRLRQRDDQVHHGDQPHDRGHRTPHGQEPRRPDVVVRRSLRAVRPVFAKCVSYGPAGALKCW
jgi:hypothetical protein